MVTSPGYSGGYAPWLDAATCATAEAVTATTSSGSRDMAGAELVTGVRRGWRPRLLSSCPRCVLAARRDTTAAVSTLDSGGRPGPRLALDTGPYTAELINSVLITKYDTIRNIQF